MGHKLRYLPPESNLVEVTIRTVQGRFLLKPTPGFREMVIGILARAQMLYPVEIHALACLSNHMHLLLSPEDSLQLADFMRHVNTNLSKEAGRLHNWSGPMFQRRYRSISISGEEAAQIDRLRYILRQGCKENLVARPADWPGAHCAEALSEGKPLTGIWFNRTAEYNARRQGQRFKPKEFADHHTLNLVPLPCWWDLAPEVVQTYVAKMVQEVERETRERHSQEGTRPLGRRAILRAHPHSSPERSKKSPAPRVHAFSQEVRRAFDRAYAAFVASFREAAARLRAGEHPCGFPEGSFPPAGPFTAPEPEPG